MAWEVIFNQFTLSATQDKVFNPNLIDIVDQSTVSAQEKVAEQVVNDMGFYMQKALNPNMQISVKVGARELSELTEGQVIPLIDGGKGPDKGIEVKPYGGKMVVSKLAYDWVNSTRTLQGADASVKQAISDFVEGLKDLRKGATQDKAIEATLLLSKGFSVTSTYGPGSATPGGQSLFDTDHPYNNGASTFRNVLGGAYGTLNDNLSATSLQNALDILKLETKTQRGHKVMKPSGSYTLIIPTELEVTAGTVLNTAGTSAGIYSGTGSNAALLNTFYFAGNKVTFISNPWFNYTTAEKGTIGNGTNWFLMNAEQMKEQRALRYISLNEGEFEVWYDEHTKNRYASMYHACAFDHFGAEAYIVGSLGTA